MTVKNRTAVGLLGLVLGTGSTAGAVELELEASRVHQIRSESGAARLLLYFPGLGEVEEEWVTTASLNLSLPGVVSVGTFGVEADLVTTDWDRNATWTSPWIRPGGDREGRSDDVSVLVGGRSTGHLSLDVTSQVRLIADGEAANRGFILVPAQTRSEGFSEDELRVLGDLSAATLEVHYRKLTALGIRGGARALLERKQAARDEGH